MSSPRLLYPLQMLPVWISRKKGNSLKSLMSQHDTVRKQKTTVAPRTYVVVFFTTGHVTLAYRGNWKGPPCLPRYEAWLWVMWVIPWWQFSIRKERFHGFLQPLHFVRSKSLLPPDPVTYNVDGFLINRKGIITPLISTFCALLHSLIPCDVTAQNWERNLDRLYWGWKEFRSTFHTVLLSLLLSID